MKKTFTFFAAMMIAAVCFAQGNVLRSANQASMRSVFDKQIKDVKAPLAKSVKAFANPVWDSDTMSYCGDEEFATTVGTGSATSTMYWGIKIEAAALVGRNTITEVQFYPMLTGAHTMKIVFGDQPTGTAAHTQTINVTSADTSAWKSVTLATPVAIPADQAMWVTFSCVGAYPAASVQGNTYPNGTYASTNDTLWVPLSQFSSTLAYTWMIRVVSDTHVTPAPIVSLEGPDAVVTGTAATWTALSPNTDSWTWYVNGTAQSSTTNVMTYTFDSDADSNMIVVEATNANGTNTTYDTLYVDSYSCDGISEFPYTLNFESGFRCWTMVSADPANDDRFGLYADEEAHSGNTDFRFSSYYRAETTGNYNQYLISPELTLPTDGQYMLKFWYKGFRQTDAFRVLASTTTGDTVALTQVLGDMPTVATEWTVAAYILPANTKYVAIDYYGVYAYYLYVDDLSIEALTAPEVSVTGTDYIKVGKPAHYTATSILADTLNWYVDGNLVAGNGNTLSYSFSTDGDHYVVAEALNSVGSATDTAYVEVFDCPSNDIPYVPTFDNGFGCWDTVSLLTQGAGWYTTSEIDLGYGQVYSMSAQSSYFGIVDIDADNWLISPFIAAGSGNYEIAWQVRPYAIDYHADHYGVYIISGTDTTLLFSETMGADTNFVWRTIALPTNLSDDFRIAFRHFESQGGFVLLLDNIQVRNLTAPVVTLEGPTTTQTSESVTYTAFAGTATSYIWTIDGTPINSSDNTAHISFEQAGNHTVQVVAVNSVGSSAPAVINVYAFTCETITEFPWTEDFESATGYECWKFIDADGDGYNWNTNYLRDYVNPQTGASDPQGHNNSNGLVGSASWASEALVPDNWMILPAMALPANSELVLSWFDKGQDVEYFSEKYSVYISTTGHNLSDFGAASGSYTSRNAWTGRNIELSQYAGQTIYIAFRHHNCTDMFYLDIDDIKVSSEHVGIDEVESSVLSLYPNPATDKVSVSAEGIEGNVIVSIVDMNGRVMMEQQGVAQRFTFDVSSLAQGAYFVRMTGENVNAVRKLVVR